MDVVFVLVITALYGVTHALVRAFERLGKAS